ncbi:hypothetical protein PTKIN_Ptkin19aG0015400 [Pterospermum kingtungense]
MHFFWEGSATGQATARVSWQAVCFPKAEEGFGLKDIYTWNQASIMKNLWDIFMQAGTLWVAWVNHYILKGQSLWHAAAHSNCSWNWRKVMSLRPIFRQFLEVKMVLKHGSLKEFGDKGWGLVGQLTVMAMEEWWPFLEVVDRDNEATVMVICRSSGEGW